MAFERGAKLGPYEIVAPIAAATEAYKATDTRLKRTVTVKVYPGRVFEKTEAVVALKHPHICALYDVLQEGADGYLISEYVEGETLAERLKRGPMDIEDVMKTGVALADALDKAHRQGVTHRGLNPSNVILTPDCAKIADFGLVAPSGRADASVSASQMSTRTVSSPSALMLSPAAGYMAPEQFEGAEGGARTDIFAFGAILYEMLTGRAAFEGKTPAMLLAAVQTVEPEPVSKLRPAVAPALDYLICQCLAKDPDQRLQTARDLLRHLQWISEGSIRVAAQAGTTAGRRKRDRILWGVAVALVLIGIGVAPLAYRYFQGAPESPEVHFSVSLPGTGNATGSTPAYISPDGRWIASARLGSNNGGLYLLQLGSVTPKYLFDGTSFYFPFWSPDSKSLAFVTDGKLKVTDVSGSPPQTISDAPFPAGGGSWSKDSIIVFSSAGVLYRVQAAGGQPVQITKLDAAQQETDHVLPSFLPDGRHFLYLAVSAQSNNSAIYVGSIDSNERFRLLASESGAQYAAPGYLLFNRGNAVFAQPFDAKTFKLTAEPIRLSDAALRAPAPTNSPNVLKSANLSVSQNGVLVYRGASPGGSPAQSQSGALALTWVDSAAQETTRVGTPGSYAGVDIAPDGKRFAVHQHEGEGGDSWFFDAGRLQRLTFNTAQDNSNPIWSHDGTKIAFGSRRNGKWGLYVKASDGTGPEDLIFESDLAKMPMSWSPDGKLLVFWVNDPKTRGDIWMVPVQGDRKPVPLVQTAADETAAQVSPDGKWMAYQSNETGTTQVYVRPFPEGSGNKSQVSVEGAPAGYPRWRGDGKELFFATTPNIVAADIKVTGSSVQPGVPHILFPVPNPFVTAHTLSYHPYAVTPDGQRFLILQPPGAPSGGGGLAGGFAAFVDQAASGSPVANTAAVNVVLNWTRNLKRK